MSDTINCVLLSVLLYILIISSIDQRSNSIRGTTKKNNNSIINN